MKKKFLSIALALVLALSMGTVAFAAGESGTDDTYDGEDMTTITFTKNYERTNDGTISPAETFSFSQPECIDVQNAGVNVTKENAPTGFVIGTAEYSAGDAGVDGKKTKKITITLPTYTAVGVYTYKFHETVGTTAGVTYYGNDIILKVTVIERDGKVRVAAVHTEAGANGKKDDGSKKDSFENTYSAGTLKVKKVVEGIMGDKDKKFTVKVAFTAPDGKTVNAPITYMEDGETKSIDVNGSTATAEIKLKNDEEITFNNIPYGVTYTVVENDYSGENYKTTYAYNDVDKNTNNIVDTAMESVTITNSKGGTIDMGVYQDSMPYVLLLAVVGVGAIVFFTKKKREN